MKVKELLPVYMLHVVTLAILFLGIRLVMHKPLLPVEMEFLQWDAEHYYNISRKGYFGINVAFFPFFSWVWKLLQVNTFVISAFNAVVFYTALTFLVKLIDVSKRQLILLLSLPGLMFMYVPYTEPLFFLFSVVVLYGLKKENIWLMLAGLFFTSITRPATYVLIIALIMLYFLKRSPENRFYTVKNLLFQIGAMALGVCIIAAVQQVQVGTWKGLFTMGPEYWNTYLQIPDFPLWSWENSTRLVLILDGAAFFIAIVTGLTLIKIIYEKLKNERPEPEGFILFAILFLAGIGATVLFGQGGKIMNINRYIFTAAYSFVVFTYWAKHYRFQSKHLPVLFGSLTFFWLFFASYSRLNTFLRLSVASAYFTSILLLFAESRIIRNLIFTGLYVFNCLAQVYMLNVFMSGEWIS